MTIVIRAAAAASIAPVILSIPNPHFAKTNHMSALLLMHSNAGCAARKRNLGLFARHRSLIRKVARAAANRDIDEVLGGANFSGYASVDDFKAYAAYAAQ